MRISMSVAEVLGVSLFISSTSHNNIYHAPQIPECISEHIHHYYDKILDQNIINHDEIYFFKDEFQLDYAYHKINGKRIIIGPFILSTNYSSPKDIILKKLNVDSNSFIYLDDYFQHLKHYEKSHLLTIIKLLKSYLSTDEIELEINEVDKTIKTGELEETNYDYVEESYAFEKRMLNIISSGNVMAMQKNFESTPVTQVKHIGTRVIGDPLRNRKNLMLTLNSITVRAAFDGGISAQLAHKLSTQYAIRVENCKTLHEVDKLSQDMLLEYTQAVHDNKISQYSHHIQHVIQFIEMNLFNKFSIAELADDLHISAEHLSRLFKREVEITLSNYILMKRIEEAKKLIVQDNYSITHISSMLQFSNPSYFSKVFKTEVGLSPKEYKKKMMR